MNQPEQMKHALLQSIEIIGSQRAVAKAMNITDTAVHAWKIYGRVPVKRVKQLSQLTKGQVSVEDLRPDIF